MPEVPAKSSRTVHIRARSRDGDVRTVEAQEGESLMAALRSAGLDVAGTCGGMCSCGSCHIYADEQMMAAAPPVSEDERDMLDALQDVVAVQPGSRLSCQIPVTRDLEGQLVEIAPQL